LSSHLGQFANAIRSTTEHNLQQDITLNGQLLLDELGPVRVSYAPFEHIERSAKVVIVGITPGAQQATNALVELRRQLNAGSTDSDALAAAKVFASFSGPMRNNLVAMLDYIGVAKLLKISSTSSLWSEDRQLVHFTSALRYPVFINGANYNGKPDMVSCRPLRKMLNECLAEEAAVLSDAVWIPLGPIPTAALQFIVKSGKIDQHQILDGLPHPSGANAERIAYFVGNKAREKLSAKTNADRLDAARSQLIAKVAKML
jgi:hypothetical protein